MKHHQPRSGAQRRQRRRLTVLSAAAIAAIAGGGAANAAPVITDPFSHRAAAASVPIGVVGDGKPDFHYNVDTGDVQFFTDGGIFTNTAGQPSFINGLTLASTAGRLIPAAAPPPFQGFSPTPNALGGALDPPGFPDAYDVGPVLPPGLSLDDLTSDLTLRYAVFTGGVAKLSDIIVVPEPSVLPVCGGAAAVAAATIARRRARQRARER
jgi:hypothetical protein